MLDNVAPQRLVVALLFVVVAIVLSFFCELKKVDAADGGYIFHPIKSLAGFSSRMFSDNENDADVVEDIPGTGVWVDVQYYVGPEYSEFVHSKINLVKFVLQNIMFVTHGIMGRISSRPSVKHLQAYSSLVTHQSPRFMTPYFYKSVRDILRQSVEDGGFLWHLIYRDLTFQIRLLEDELISMRAETFHTKKFRYWSTMDSKSEIFSLICKNRQADRDVSSPMHMKLADYLDVLASQKKTNEVQKAFRSAAERKYKLLGNETDKFNQKQVTSEEQEWLTGFIESFGNAASDLKSFIKTTFCVEYEIQSKSMFRDVPAALQGDSRRGPLSFSLKDPSLLGAMADDGWDGGYTERTVGSSPGKGGPTAEQMQSAEEIMRQLASEAQESTEDLTVRNDGMAKSRNYEWKVPLYASVKIVMSSASRLSEFQLIRIEEVGSDVSLLKRIRQSELILKEWAQVQAAIWYVFASPSHCSLMLSRNGLTTKIKLRTDLICTWDDTLKDVRIVERLLANVAPITPDAWTVVGQLYDSSVHQNNFSEKLALVESYAQRIPATAGGTTKDVRRHGMCSSHGLWQLPEAARMRSSCAQFPTNVEPRNKRHTIYSQCLSLFPVGTQFVIDTVLKVAVPAEIQTRVKVVKSKIETLMKSSRGSPLAVKYAAAKVRSFDWRPHGGLEFGKPATRVSAPRPVQRYPPLFPAKNVSGLTAEPQPKSGVPTGVSFIEAPLLLQTPKPQPRSVQTSQSKPPLPKSTPAPLPHSKNINLLNRSAVQPSVPYDVSSSLSATLKAIQSISSVHVQKFGWSMCSTNSSTTGVAVPDYGGSFGGFSSATQQDYYNCRKGSFVASSAYPPQPMSSVNVNVVFSEALNTLMEAEAAVSTIEQQLG